jgi:hypothetical protein
MIDNRMTETQALEWLLKRGICISVRTIKDMRAKGEIGHFKLPRGRSRILYAENHLVDAFIGVEITPIRRTERSKAQKRSDAELSARLRRR